MPIALIEMILNLQKNKRKNFLDQEFRQPPGAAWENLVFIERLAI